MAKKPASNESRDDQKQSRITLEPDLAEVLTDKSRGKKRGYASRLVNRILRERFVQLGWIADELRPANGDVD